MRRLTRFVVLTLAVFGLALAPGVASAVIITDNATTLTFQLDCVIVDGCDAGTTVASYGTIKFEDSGNDVVVTATLASGLKILYFAFNFDPALSSTGWSVTPESIDINPNAVGADGWTSVPGFFDAGIPDSGNLGNISTFVGTISKTGVDLDEDNFRFQDTSGQIWVALHIGNCLDTACRTVSGGQSLWVGSLVGTPVPEPGTLLLLGTGLVGLGALSRRMRTRK